MGKIVKEMLEGFSLISYNQNVNIRKLLKGGRDYDLWLCKMFNR